MKKFVIKVAIYFVIVAMLCFIPSIVIDPFNVFHPLSIRETGVEPNKNYIKTVYLLDNPDRFDSFLLGSSHVAVMNVEHFPGHCYNGYYSGAIPEENEKTLRTLVENGILPETVYLGVDALSYVDCYEDHTKERLRIPYQFSETDPLDFWMMYLDPVVNLKAAAEVLKNPEANIFEPSPYQWIFYGNGGQLAYGITTELNKEEMDALVPETYAAMVSALEEMNHYPETYRYMDRQIEAIGRMKELCDENGIELKVFINPMFFLQFADAVENSAFLSFLTKLAEVTDYTSFCGFNRYTTDCSYYYADCSHYFCELGDVVIDVLNQKPVDETAYSQGFGRMVTKENVGAYIRLLTDPAAFCR